MTMTAKAILTATIPINYIEDIPPVNFYDEGEPNFILYCEKRLIHLTRQLQPIWGRHLLLLLLLIVNVVKVRFISFVKLARYFIVPSSTP
jgi:hypothetical protein